MPVTYTAYIFDIAAENPVREILIAELSAAGFDSFMEEEKTLTAYIEEAHDRSDILENMLVLKDKNPVVTYRRETLRQENWNALWESNFSPIQVDEQCYIRAPFHPVKKVKHEIIISPKMSFGTGHHETTYMMVQYLLAAEVTHKNVLDMGCGTGVLAILAAQKGAKSVEAVDIDEWCYRNTQENMRLNHCRTIRVYQGGAELLTHQQYHIILANINRNILLRDMPSYTEVLQNRGQLFLSGFYKEDLPLIREKCRALGLIYRSHKTRNKWVAAAFEKADM